MTPKQKRFCEEYLIDLNSTQAAIRAGYSFCKSPLSSYYVYLLVDPRDDRIFYVGKGIRKRISMHSRNAKSGKIDNAEKHKIISSIHEEGYQVEEVVFSLHEKEREAFSVERMLIENLRNAGLTNIVGGVVTNEELVQQQAICLLSRLKSFEEWIISAKPYQLTSAQKMRGSERACYDSIRHELLMISQSC